MAIGLKGFFEDFHKETNGMSFIYKIKRIKNHLFYAWERAWYGYDSIELFNIDAVFRERYIEMLTEYKDHHISSMNVPEKYVDVFHKYFFSEEETTMIIETMIYHLKMMDQDYVEKVLYGKNIYDDDYDFDKDFSMDKFKHTGKIVEQNKNLFMNLFNEIFWYLWD